MAPGKNNFFNPGEIRVEIDLFTMLFGWKWAHGHGPMDPSGPKRAQAGPSGPKWAQVGPSGPSGPKWSPSGPKWAQVGPNGPKWAQVGPKGHFFNDLRVFFCDFYDFVLPKTFLGDKKRPSG